MPGCDPGRLSALSMYLCLILQQRPGARTPGLGDQTCSLVCVTLGIVLGLA